MSADFYPISTVMMVILRCASNDMPILVVGPMSSDSRVLSTCKLFPGGG